MAILSAIFWYLIGGLTLLPLSILIGYSTFLLLVPRIATQSDDSLQDDSFPLDSQLKAAALDLAVRNDSNAKAHLKHSESIANHPKGHSSVPPSAKRLGPPPNNLPPLPHRSGTLVVTRHFHQDAASTVAGSSSGSSLPVGNAQDQSSNGKGSDGNGSNKSGYMSGLYRGLMDYRTNKKAANSSSTTTSSNPASLILPKQSVADVVASTSKVKSISSSASSSSSSSSSTIVNLNKPPSGTGSMTTFHCILKPPILYLYSSSDVSSPMTECHAAIDLRGKRVSLFINGVGDTMGEPGEDEDEDEEDEDDGYDNDSNQPIQSRNATVNQYDTTSSTNVSDVDLDNPSSNLNHQASRPSTKRAQRNWNKARRATIRDGELFQKRNAIRIVAMGAGEGKKDRNHKRDGMRSRSKSPSSKSTSSTTPTNRAQWFIFCKSASQLEDWYHSLLHASLLPTSILSSQSNSNSASFDADSSPIGNLFDPDHMVQLLASLDSIPDPIPLRWFNAVLARIFFSVYKTSALENYITRKIMKKLSRVKTPGFLGDIVVREVDVGDRPPMFSRPMLKSATGEGEASMEVSVHYTGSLRITISTTLTISLSSRLGLKPYTVPLVLAVVVRSLNGNLLLHVKPPPSNRLWFGFTKLPELEIEVQPVVSERKVQWGMVTRLIEGRIRELLAESIVLPNMDDIPFFDTRQFTHRGGIWSDAGKGAAGASSQDSDAVPSQTIPQVSSSSKVKSQGATSSAPTSIVGTPESEFPSSKSSALEVPGAGSSMDGSTRRRKNSNSSRVHLSPAASARPSTSTSAEALAVGAPAVLNSAGSSLDDPFVGSGTSKLSSSPSSAAAAGLSSLLARDFAAQSQVEVANGNSEGTKNSSAASLPAQLDGATSSTSSSGDRPQIQAPNKRRSWFVGSRFGNGSSASSPSSEHGPSSPAVNVPSSISRKGPQSSLAWGNASLSLPPGSRSGNESRTASSSVSTTNSSPSHPALGNSFESESNLDHQSSLGASLSSTTSANPTHRRNKDSVSSWSTEESDEGRVEAIASTGGDESGNESIKSADTDSFRAGMERAFEMDQDEVSKGEEEEEETTTPGQDETADPIEPPTPRRASHPNPTVNVQEPSNDEAPLSPPDASEFDPPLTPVASTSNPTSRRGSAQSLIPRLKGTPPRSQDSDLALSREKSEENLSSLASRKSTASTAPTTDSNSSWESDASSITTADNVPSSSPSSSSGKVFGASHGFPPPLLRSATLKAQQGNSGRSREPSDPSSPTGSSPMSAAQQNRYGLGSNLSSPPSASSSGTSSTLLLNSWNKAKASMADKESRQAAAKEAKDALKKGWASWNTKRLGGASQDPSQQFQSSTNFPSQGYRSNQRETEESASQIPSRSRTSSWLGEGAAETSDPASLGLGFDVDRVDSTSRTSSTASSNDGGDSKDRFRDDDSRSSGSERTPYKDYRLQKSKGGAQRQGNLSQSQILASTAQWSANVPSLSAPAPAARRKDDELNDPNSKSQSSSTNSTAASHHSSSRNPGSPNADNLDPKRASSIPRPSTQRLGSNSSLNNKASTSTSPEQVPNLNCAPPQAPQPMRKGSVNSLSSDNASSPQLNATSPKLEHAEVRRGSAPGSMSPPVSSSRIPSASSVSSSTSSSSKSAGIKTQPGRATMMVVPHSMSRGPQSFSSPTPEPAPLPSNQSANQDGQKGLGLSMFRDIFNKQQAQDSSGSSTAEERIRGSENIEGEKPSERPETSSNALNFNSTESKSSDIPTLSQSSSGVKSSESASEAAAKTEDEGSSPQQQSNISSVSYDSDPSPNTIQPDSISNEVGQEESEIVKASLQNEHPTTAEEAETGKIALGPEDLDGGDGEDDLESKVEKKVADPSRLGEEGHE